MEQDIQTIVQDVEDVETKCEKIKCQGITDAFKSILHLFKDIFNICIFRKKINIE